MKNKQLLIINTLTLLAFIFVVFYGSQHMKVSQQQYNENTYVKGYKEESEDQKKNVETKNDDFKDEHQNDLLIIEVEDEQKSVIEEHPEVEVEREQTTIEDAQVGANTSEVAQKTESNKGKKYNEEKKETEQKQQSKQETPIDNESPSKEKPEQETEENDNLESEQETEKDVEEAAENKENVDNEDNEDNEDESSEENETIVGDVLEEAEKEKQN